MILSEDEILEFQNLCKRHGKETTKKEACEIGIKFLRLVELVFQPITKAEHNKHNLAPKNNT